VVVRAKQRDQITKIVSRCRFVASKERDGVICQVPQRSRLGTSTDESSHGIISTSLAYNRGPPKLLQSARRAASFPKGF
jgi:hypothetical protein